MIALVVMIVLAAIGVMLLVCVLALFAGFFAGVLEQLVWLWDKLHGGHKVPPWRKRSGTPGYNGVRVPAEVRARVMARDGFVCVYCGAQSDLTVDHVIPRVLGGSNDMENLVTACRPCNSRKGPHPGAHARVRHGLLMLWHAERVAARNGHGH